MITLYKYGNRKIYSPFHKRYLRLNEVDWATMRILDHKTKNDVTWVCKAAYEAMVAWRKYEGLTNV